MKWKKETPIEAKKAGYEVRRAVAKGVLTRPNCCSVCHVIPGIDQYGRNGIEAHHHKGYDSPLDVQWLCMSCHRRSDSAKGERHRSAKLTLTQVNDIISDKCESSPVTAKRYGVHESTIRRIRSGTYWSKLVNGFTPREPRSKISKHQIPYIRTRIATGEQMVLIAKTFGVKPNVIYAIKAGRNYKNV